MSINIPEIIAPSSLFTSTESLLTVGSFPNGDDALIIDGVSGNFRAYQAASSGVHYTSDPTAPMTIVFWCHPQSTSASGVTALRNQAFMFGVMDINAALNSSVTSATAGFAWGVSLGSGSHSRNFNYHRSVGASARNYVRFCDANGMKMYAIRDPGNGTPTCRVDGLNVPSSANIAAAGTQGTPGALSDPHFCIGPYSTVAGWHSTIGVPTLGKIGIWIGTLLSDEDLADLYTSMLFGPPSP